MHPKDFQNNFDIIKKEKIVSKERFFENILYSSIKFSEENELMLSIISINEELYWYIKNIFCRYRQLVIPFIEKDLKEICLTPFLNVETDKGIFQICFNSKVEYDYLKIKTPENKNIFLILWITDVSSHEIFFIYDSEVSPDYDSFEENNHALNDFYSKIDQILYKFSDYIYNKYRFYEELSFFENIVFSIDEFLYSNHQIPNVIIINEEKYELIESQNNQGLLQKEIFKINSGMMSEIQIKLDNEDIIQILVENKNKENLYVLQDDKLLFNEFILIYDDLFPGFDDYDDDDDDDFIITPPILSPVFCEVVC